MFATVAVLALMVFHMISMHYEEEVYYYLCAPILLIIGGLALFRTVIAPIICGIAAIYSLYLFLSVTFEVLWIYLVAHIVIIVVACIWCRIQKDSIYTTSYLNHFTKERSDAREKDARNEKENANRAAAAKRNLENSLTPQIEAAKQKCVEFETKINNLQGELWCMTCLAEKDWCGIDFLIEMMTTGHADSIKEAPPLWDEQRRKNGEVILRQFQRELQQIQDEWDRDCQQRELEAWKSEQLRREEREHERREEHRQTVENTLEEISKELDD